MTWTTTDGRRALGALLAIAVCGVLPRGQAQGRDVRLTIREGTSMAAAVSPDGRTIALDLLGALWTTSVEGGPARRILEDGYDAHLPAWSPDGTRIAFQAYLRDTWHIWTVNADGSGLQEVTSGPFDDREPHWSPDGTRLAFSSDRGGSYDVWILTLGSGEVSRFTSHAANDSMPAWSPDGREIAFVSDRAQRGIYARAVEAGTERLLAAEAGAPWSPAWTPDGRTVAYVAVAGAASRLMLGGAPISDPGEDVFPFRPHFTGGDIVYTADGTIKRRPLAAGAIRAVPFSAEIAFTRAAFAPKGRSFAARGPQPVRGLMHPVIAPDGSRVAFAALGDLWTLSTAGGEAVPERVTHDASVEMNPAWSPDGHSLAFSSDRGGEMDLWVRDLRTGADRRVAPGGEKPSWSPDGTRLAYLDPLSQLRVVDVKSLEGRQAHERLNEPGRPSWSPDGRSVVMSALRPYSSRFREGTNQVLWVQVEPNPSTSGRDAFAPDRWFDPLPHKSIGMRENLGPVWSPDGRQMAAIIDGHLHVYPVSPDGAPAGPPRRLSPDLASSPSWTGDSRRLLYQGVDRFRLVDLDDGHIRDVVPQLTWEAARRPAEVITVHAGRLFDGRGSGARDGMDVVIEGNRITQVEAHRDELHRGTVVDASAQTVLPGLIESHTHLSKAYGEALGRIWLAFGITTIRNPAANPFEANEDRESIEAGVRIGPRVVSTGEPLDGTRIYYPGGVALDSGTLVESYIARAEALGFDFIKTYVRLPDRIQKRVIEAAHRAGLPVTSHEIYPAVAYGADGVEHIRGTSRRGFSPKMSETRRSYRDVIDLLAASGMTLTPTIGIQGGHQLLTLRDAAWLDDIRLSKLFPAAAVAPSRALSARAGSAADLAGREALVAPQERTAAAVVRAGGRIVAGTDSPINPYALSLLLELEHFVRGGLSPAEAIRSATIVPAEAMGLAADLGTIEPGKLADLVIVDGNPLANIADLRRTRRVFKDGVRYDVDALLARPTPVPSPPGRP